MPQSQHMIVFHERLIGDGKMRSQRPGTLEIAFDQRHHETWR